MSSPATTTTNHGHGEAHALAAIRAPLYLLRNRLPKVPEKPTIGKHCLNTDPDPAKIPFNSDLTYFVWNRIGTILTAPLDGAVPLYLCTDGNRYAFTYQAMERQGWFTGPHFDRQALIGYVHTTQTAGDGRIPLRRLWNNSIVDHAYATDDNEVAALKAVGYVVEENFKCYVYPA